MKSKLYSVALWAGLSLFANSVWANTAPAALNMAVVDAQQIMEKSIAVGKIREQLEKKYESYGKESSKKEEYFKKKFEDLEKQKSVLSKESFEEKDAAVHKELADAQKKFQADQASLEKSAYEAHQKVENSLIDIVKEEAAKSGFKMVMQKSQIVYAEDSLDITPKVLEALNKKLPSVDVKF